MLSQKAQSYLKQATRLLMIALLSITIAISSVTPALANSRNQGEASLNEIQRRTDSAAYENPEDIQPQRVSNESDALNLVQGNADKNKMKNSGESQNNTTGKEQAESFFSKLTGDQ